MRRDGIWHPRLIEVLTGLGHTDLIVIADAGLPVAEGVERIDLLWGRGEPGFPPRTFLGRGDVSMLRFAWEDTYRPETIVSAVRPLLRAAGWTPPSTASRS